LKSAALSPLCFKSRTSMSRGTAFALLLSIGSCEAYVICVEYADNVPQGHSDFAGLFHEDPNAYVRVFPPGSHGAGSKSDVHVSDTTWSRDIKKVFKPAGSRSWFNTNGYCFTVAGKSIQGELAYDATSSVAVEVWHNKLSSLRDRQFDQKFGTCQLPLDKEHPYYHSTWQDRDVAHITKPSDGCVFLDHHACDGLLLSSTSFHLKMCISDHEPPPSPPPPSPPSPPPPPPPAPPPPPDCVCPAGFKPKGNPTCEPIHFVDYIHEESTASSMGETRFEDGRAADIFPAPALLLTVGAMVLLFTGFMAGKSYGKNKSEPAAGML